MSIVSKVLKVGFAGLILAIGFSGCTSGARSNITIVNPIKAKVVPKSINDIEIFLSEPNRKYKAIGTITVTAGIMGGDDIETATNRVLTELKKQALKNGANGIILNDEGIRLYGVVGGVVKPVEGGIVCCKKGKGKLIIFTN